MVGREAVDIRGGGCYRRRGVIVHLECIAIATTRPPVIARLLLLLPPPFRLPVNVRSFVRTLVGALLRPRHGESHHSAKRRLVATQRRTIVAVRVSDRSEEIRFFFLFFSERPMLTSLFLSVRRAFANEKNRRRRVPSFCLARERARTHTQVSRLPFFFLYVTA